VYSLLLQLCFAAILAATAIAGIVFVVRRARGVPVRGAVVATVGAIWLAATLFMTLRPGPGIGVRVNLEPLSFAGRASEIDAVLNIGVFVPFGVLLAAAGVRLFGALLLGLGVSLFIEVAQYLGDVGRTADINDLITNTLGTVLGCALALVIARLTRRAGPRHPLGS
jgi:glycopeptide antibiotics resistance protein